MQIFEYLAHIVLLFLELALISSLVTALTRSIIAKNQQKMSASLKLMFFDGRGNVETSRCLLAVAEIPYEDKRFSISCDAREFPEFAAARERGEFKAGMDQAPLLVIGNDVSIGQTKAIERYIARRGGLMGSNDIEAAQIDCICEHVRDIKDKYAKVQAITDEAEKETAMNKWFTTEFTEWLSKLEMSLPSGRAAGYCVGNKVSYADVTVWNLLSDFFRNPQKEGVAASVKPCVQLVGIVDTVAALPALQKWLAERPQTNW